MPPAAPVAATERLGVLPQRRLCKQQVRPWQAQKYYPIMLSFSSLLFPYG